MRSQKSVVLHEPFASPGDAAPKRKDGYQPLDGEPTPRRHGFLLLAFIATFIALLFLPEFRRGLGVSLFWLWIVPVCTPPLVGTPVSYTHLTLPTKA